MSNKEQHLFILWEKARHKEKEILLDMQFSFKIIKEYEIFWDEDKFRLNLSSFYAEDFEYDTYQESIRGKGSFLAVLVEDAAPVYKDGINQNTFTFKHKWRDILGSFTIHGTDNLKQVKHDVCLLTGKSLSDILKTEKLDGKRIKLHQNLPCVDGWTSLEQIFYILNETVNYVVLRNFDLLPNEYKIDEHGDIDILVEDAPTFIAVVKKHNNLLKNSFNFRNTVNYADTSVLFHTKILGDNYYDRPFEKRILETSILNKKGIKIPSNEMYFYSLLYHALYHKNSISKTYIPILEKYAKLNNVVFKNNWKYLAKVLNDYMKKNNFKYHLIFMEDDFRIPRKKVYDKSLISNENDLLFYSCNNLGTLVVNKLMILKNKELITRLITYYNRVCHLEGHYLDKNNKLYKEHIKKSKNGEIAWFYKLRFGKIVRTTFYLKHNKIWVKRELLNEKGYCGNNYIHFVKEKDRKYSEGTNFYHILQKNRNNDKALREQLEIYIGEVFRQFSIPNSNLLQNKVWDIVPTNCIVTSENKYVFYDFEYEANGNGCDKSYILYRILLHSALGDKFEEYYEYFCKKFLLENKFSWCSYMEELCFNGILDLPEDRKKHKFIRRIVKLITCFIPSSHYRKKYRENIFNYLFNKDKKILKRYFVL